MLIIIIVFVACFTVFACLAQWAISRKRTPNPGLFDALRYSAMTRDTQETETKRRVAQIVGRR